MEMEIEFVYTILLTHQPERRWRPSFDHMLCAAADKSLSSTGPPPPPRILIHRASCGCSWVGQLHNFGHSFMYLTGPCVWTRSWVLIYPNKPLWTINFQAPCSSFPKRYRPTSARPLHQGLFWAWAANPRFRSSTSSRYRSSDFWHNGDLHEAW